MLSKLKISLKGYYVESPEDIQCSVTTILTGFSEKD
jgi:hypothetical protein